MGKRTKDDDQDFANPFASPPAMEDERSADGDRFGPTAEDSKPDTIIGALLAGYERRCQTGASIGLAEVQLLSKATSGELSKAELDAELARLG